MSMSDLKSNRWNVTAQFFGKGDCFCTCCGRDLSGHAIRMLELDQRVNAYHDFRGVPENKSQGWFPFGLTCARKEITKAELALKELAP